MAKDVGNRVVVDVTGILNLVAALVLDMAGVRVAAKVQRDDKVI